MKTIAVSNIGDQLTVTGAIERVLGPTTIVVDGVDLPKDGLLVLGRPRTGVRVYDLVTVTGTVARFAYDQMAPTYELTGADPYREFADRKVLIADEIQSHAR
ncbi:hypothetical protein AB0F81_38655 [Actinoplanes sp. NPDC024001]|uniref:hypothetical protein n=1 Tax=Actinoplanes sp. NPDC024001 TaxID=3154598 RepID=UPI0033E36A73